MAMNQPPVQLGPYKMGKTLGVGSFGKVKLAEHELTGHKVAIKILNRQKIRRSGKSDMVKREISILRKMRHTHVNRLYEVIDTPTDIFLVLEYVAGGELFDFIVSKGRLAPEEARHFFQQIIAGVEYCHFHGVAHRDLKPENLLLDDDNNIKIADFGLSNIMQDGDFLRTPCGSPNYAAPEVISINWYAGPEVDVWSSGVILYALMCGRLPFDEENLPMLVKKIKGGMYMLPSHLPPLARDLIARMLVVDPLKRITIPEIRKHPWFLEDLPVYLQRSPEVLEKEAFKINEDVLKKCLALRAARRVSREQLISLLTRETNHPLAVAYEMILDHETTKLRVGEREEVRAESSIPKAFEAKDMRTVFLPGQASRLINQSPQQRPLGSATYGGSVSSSSGTATVLAANRRRWYLGIQSKKDPAHVMSEVYKALHVLGFDWHVVSPYLVKCRWQPPVVAPPSPEGEEPSPPPSSLLPVKIGLQLYKVQQFIYLLDFQKLDGNAFTYMNLCAQIVTELKSLSNARPMPNAADALPGFDHGGHQQPQYPHVHPGAMHAAQSR